MTEKILHEREVVRVYFNEECFYEKSKTLNQASRLSTSGEDLSRWLVYRILQGIYLLLTPQLSQILSRLTWIAISSGVGFAGSAMITNLSMIPVTSYSSQSLQHCMAPIRGFLLFVPQLTHLLHVDKVPTSWSHHVDRRLMWLGQGQPLIIS